MEEGQEKQVNGRMTIRLKIYKKAGVDNALETTLKLITLMPKDVSGSMRLSATLYDPKNNFHLWSKAIEDTSFRLFVEENINIEKKANELFKSFD